MRFIETPEAPLPAGHYSQAVVANGFVFVSGLLPIVPNSNRRIPEGIRAQAEQTFANLSAVLKGAESGIEQLVSVQVFIPDITVWGEINEVYRGLLGEHKPARTVVPCGSLRDGALIEVNAVAVVAPRNAVSRTIEGASQARVDCEEPLTPASSTTMSGMGRSSP
ncbi:MAG TPA: RidA family protein [Candidatus Baltobacteraceae bacterium]|jgi:reactive intermediate/imine deaminase|nr:RidA family protein [Candidatus Baltobacteraceae bacterium]